MEAYAFGPFVLEPARGQLLRDGRPVALGQRAIALLRALLDAKGEAVSKSRLIEAAWPGTIVEEVNLTVQIAGLRKALGTAPDGQEWIATLPRVGYRLPRPVTEEASRRDHFGSATIAVMPFENLSDDPQQGYFADGIAEDTITALSRFPTIAVVARNSSFSFRDRSTDVREIGARLGARYLRDGSVRRAGDRLRVNAQLVDASSGTGLWADKFDVTAGDLFEVQDRITESVVGLVEPRLRKAEVERARSKRPDNLDAYDLYLRALPNFNGVAADGFEAATTLLEKALALEPETPILVAYTAWAHEKRRLLGLPDLHPDPMRGLTLARKGIRISGDDPLALAISSLVILILGTVSDAPACLEAVRRAYEVNPNNLVVCNALSIMHTGGDGNLDLAMEAYRRVLQLSPGAPETYEALTGVGTVHFYRGNYPEAIAWLSRSLDTGTEWQPTYWHLAAAWAGLGNEAEARAVIEKLKCLTPNVSLGEIEAMTAGNGFTRYQAEVVDRLRRSDLLGVRTN